MAPKKPAHAPVAPATSTDAVLAQWAAARTDLVAVLDAAVKAQAAIEALPEDASDAQKHDAQMLQSETRQRVEAAQQAILQLPDLPVGDMGAAPAKPLPDLDAVFLAELDKLATERGVSRGEVLIFAGLYLADAERRKAEYARVEEHDEVAAVAGPTILTVDMQASRHTLRPVKVIGPREGRYRAGHHFTDVAQHLLVSEGTHARLKGDPSLMVAFED